MKELFGIAFVIIILCFMAYGGWKFKRHINYKLSYQNQVQEEMEPMVVRIENLEKRVSELEKKK